MTPNPSADHSGPAIAPLRPEDSRRVDDPMQSGRFSDLLERLFVAGVWLVMTGCLLAWGAAFAGPVPYFDDWGFIPVLCGERPLTAEWLWEPINDHRFPLGRFLVWCFWNISHGQPRIDAFFDVILLAGSALLLTGAAARLRGRVKYTDAFFSLALLHWAHAELLPYLISSYGFLSIALICVLLWFLAGLPERRGLSASLTAGMCLLLLPLQGGQGAVQTPAMALAVGYLGWREIRSGFQVRRRNGVIMLASAASACVMIGAYLIGFRGVSKHNFREVGPADMVVAGLEFVCTSLGAFGGRAWPLSGAVMAVFVLLTVAALLYGWRSRADERERTVGLLLALLSTLSVAVAIGIARAGLGGGASRYVPISTPIVCCLYLVWCHYGPRAFRSFVQMVMFSVLCAVATYHMSTGMELGKRHRQKTQQFQEDIEAGIPLMGLAGRHASYWCWDEKPLADGLQALRTAGVGIFAAVRPDPPFETRPLPLDGASGSGAVGNRPRLSATNPDASLFLSLGRSEFIYAVRLKFEIENSVGQNPPTLQLLWPREDRVPWEPYQIAEFPVKLQTGPKQKTQTVWIHGRIDHFYVRLADGPATFRFEAIEVLTPPPGGTESRR